ncbi:MAG: histidine--tRNA ligase [Alphaproteobacteria bacterium TMED93]|nr:MAG: histidine--tRNA ligase [Alphaproteobacteria bacterium TMED93]
MNNRKISTVRGMHDTYGTSFYKQRSIIESFIKVVSLLNFTPMNTPIIEHSEVFLRTLGDSSDVVMKEMYTFLDKSNDSVTLRPEGTAGIARALISNGFTQNLPQKYFYYGPMFRYERPQQGRLRQFNQVGLEFFGKGSYFEDCEVIRAAHHFLIELDIKKDVKLKINTIGKTDSRKSFIKEIKAYFYSNKKKLSSDSLKRLDRNPLRILDSKAPEDIALLEKAPVIYDFLKTEEVNSFKNVKSTLKELDISFTVDPYLVRGLDYYSDTTFEFTLTKNDRFAVLAGGRYDNLINELGGGKISGVGWAAGVERLESLLLKGPLINLPILLIPTNEKYMNYVLRISNKLYFQNVKNQILDHFNLKKSLKYANKVKAKIVLIIGDEEFKSSKFSLKNLESGTQVTVNEKELFEKIKNE